MPGNYSYPNKRQRTLAKSDTTDLSFLGSLDATDEELRSPVIEPQSDASFFPPSLARGDIQLPSVSYTYTPLSHSEGHENHTINHAIYKRSTGSTFKMPIMNVPILAQPVFRHQTSSTNISDLSLFGGSDGTGPISRSQLLDRKFFFDRGILQDEIPWSENSSFSCSNAQNSLSPELSLPVLEHDPSLNSMLSNTEKLPRGFDIISNTHKECIPHLKQDADDAKLSSVEPTKKAPLTNPNTKIMKRAQDAFKRLVPLLNSASTSNYGSALAGVLRECGDHVALDDFYNLLYNYEPSKEAQSSDLKCLKLCHLVLEWFKNPENSQAGLVQNPRLSSINFHELSRSFFGMNVIFGALTKVEDPYSAIQKIHLYKAYYIMCQKLLVKYPAITNSMGLDPNLILGQSAVGKVTTLVFPDLVTKRLGKRGHSKVHYVGVTWNKSMVDEEILSMLDLDVSEIRKLIKSSVTKTAHKKKQPELTKPRHREDEVTTKMTPVTVPAPLSQKSLYSYVSVLSTFPGLDFSPRSWKETPNSVPKHSKWAEDNMEKSNKFLRRYKVDLEPLFQMFYAGIYSNNCLSRTVIQAMKMLSEVSSPKETFLHLYLAVILLILPSVLASDQEVPCASKNQLRDSIKTCIACLESEVEHLPYVDINDLTNFTQILRTLINLNEMSSRVVKKSFTKAVLREMVRDIKYLSHPVKSLENHSAIESIVIRGVIIAMKAYDVGLTAKIPATKNIDDTVKIRQIAKAVLDTVMIFTEELPDGENTGHVTSDIPYQVFKTQAAIFHKLTSSYQEIVQLPTMVMISIVSLVCREMENGSFNKFGKHDPELCTETFKSWWINSSIFQEYVTVISEVIALSQDLNCFGR